MPLPTPASKEAGPDAPRDPRLQAALRHAPDHAARPPAAIEARILEAARRAAAPGTTAAAAPTPARAGWRQRLAHAIEGLLRPGPAAAFASLMLATVIGVMWRDGPPPESTADTTAAPRSATAAHEKTAETTAVTSADRPTDAAKPAPPQAPPAAVTSPPPTPAIESAHDRSAAGGASRAESTRPVPEVPSQHTSNAAPRPKAAAPGLPSEAAMSPPVVTAAPPEPTPEPANSARELGRSAESKAQAVPPAAAAPMGLSSATTADPLAPVVDRLTARPPVDRASPASEGAPMAEAIDLATPARWAEVLNELRPLTAGRWSIGPLPVASGAVRRTIPAADGTPQGELIVTDDAVAWQPRGLAAERVWRAPLATDEAARLRARLAVQPSTPPRAPQR